MNLSNLNFEETPEHEPSVVHIYSQKRNAKKVITLICGLAPDLDLKKISKALRKTYNTSSAIIKDKNDNLAIKINGDLKYEIRDFLFQYKIVDKNDAREKIILHGV